MISFKTIKTMRKTIGFYSIIILLWIFMGLSKNNVSAQCSGELLNISAATHSQTGTVGNVTVPAGGPYLIKVTAKGAKGGIGGAGAIMIGDFIVASGQTLESIAGAPGSSKGGGGGSGSRIQGGLPIIIAGGGGGAGGPGLTTTGGGGGGSWYVTGGGGGGGLNSAGGGATYGGGAGFNALGGVCYNGTGGGGYGGGGGGGINGGGGGGQTGGNAFGPGTGGQSYNPGSNQMNTEGGNNAGGQVIIECLGSAVFTASFTPTQPVCTNPVQGSLSIDLTGNLDGNTHGLEYAIVAGSSFTGSPAFSSITSDPFNITSGFGTTGDFTGKTYTIRIRLKYNPVLFIDNTYTLTTPCNCTMFVNDNATGANNGTSWTDAFTDLQSALAVACTGAEIWVAAGTYYPTTGTDRNATFSMKNGVGIYGGFDGSETLLSQSDWLNNTTVLSGNIGNPNDASDNSYSVVYAGSGVTSSAELNGFTIRDASGSGYGGGLMAEIGSPTINHCIFRNNSSSYVGGGLSCLSSSPIVINCIFRENYSTNFGGGMSNIWGGTPIVTNCSFIGNQAAFTGGGGVYSQDAVMTITNCTFSGNLGEAIHCNTAANVSNCIFWGNANNIYNATAALVNCIVQGGYTPCTACPNGNGNADPLFVDLTNFDLHLKYCSPAIDAGTNTGAPPDDLDGNPRPYNGTSDIGAYEFQGLVLPMVIETAQAGPFDDNDTWTGGCPPPNPIPDGFTININHAVTNPQGATITNNGTINAAGGTLTNYGTYQGNGSFIGNFINNGTVKPGNQNN
jgi:hypothetical protein